jgi:hypothetical protein
MCWWRTPEEPLFLSKVCQIHAGCAVTSANPPQMLRAPAARNKGCYFYIPLYGSSKASARTLILETLIMPRVLRLRHGTFKYIPNNEHVPSIHVGKPSDLGVPPEWKSFNYSDERMPMSSRPEFKCARNDSSARNTRVFPLSSRFLRAFQFKLYWKSEQCSFHN